MKCVDVLVPKDALTRLSTGTTTGLITSDNCDFLKHDSKILHAPAWGFKISMVATRGRTSRAILF